MSNRRSGLGWIALVWMTVVAATPARAQQPASVEALAARSSFVFQGTVVQVGASTATIPRGPNTAVVHVDYVLDAAPDMPRLKGNDVTVRLRDPKALKAGAQRIFFTQPYSFGQTAGVDEIGSLPAANRDQVASEIKAARQKAADAALAARLSSAEAVASHTDTTLHVETTTPGSGRDGHQCRPAVHPDGTVYVAFTRWTPPAARAATSCWCATTTGARGRRRSRRSRSARSSACRSPRA